MNPGSGTVAKSRYLGVEESRGEDAHSCDETEAESETFSPVSVCAAWIVRRARMHSPMNLGGLGSIERNRQR